MRGQKLFENKVNDFAVEAFSELFMFFMLFVL